MIQNYNGYKVLREFLIKPTKGFRLRELSRNLNLGLPSIINYIKQLEKEGLILKKQIHEINLYFANRENRLFKIYKIQDTMFNLENSKLLSFLEQQLNYPTIILFGSKANGEDIETSDYDLAVFTETKKNLDLKEFESKLNSKIQIFLFNKNNIRTLKLKNKELLNSITNGITLRGMLKII